MLGEDVDRYIQRARDLHYGCTYLAAHRSGYSSAPSAPRAKHAVSWTALQFPGLHRRLRTLASVWVEIGEVVGVVSQYLQATPLAGLMT
jgi:hypothetical protein